MPDARVDQAIGEIDHEIDGHHDHSDQQDAALQDRIVAAIDRLDQPFADAGQEKSVSVRMAPVNSTPICRPITVMIGMSALRSA